MDPLNLSGGCHDALAGHKQAVLLAAKEKKPKAMVATSFPSPPHLLFPFSPPCLLLLLLFLFLLFPLFVSSFPSSPPLPSLLSPSLLLFNRKNIADPQSKSGLHCHPALE